MNIHLAFDLLSATSTMIVTYALSKGILAPSIKRIERIGTVYYVALAIGAIWGAFALGTLNLWISGVGGLGRSILGALLGAIVMVELSKLLMGAKSSTGALFVPAFTLSVVIGRWGCFFTGLPDQTYGIHSPHVFAVDFGDGPRHPVQLYESATMAVAMLLWVVLMRQKPDFFRKYGFYLMCTLYGGQRFIWEFLKPYETVIGPFNIFHIGCAILVVYGLWMIKFARRQA